MRISTRSTSALSPFACAGILKNRENANLIRWQNYPRNTDIALKNRHAQSDWGDEEAERGDPDRGRSGRYCLSGEWLYEECMDKPDDNEHRSSEDIHVHGNGTEFYLNARTYKYRP